MFPKKSIKSRYAIAQVNNNNYATITVGSKSDTALEAGYIWIPYIIPSSPNIIIESKPEMRKSKIRNIINNL